MLDGAGVVGRGIEADEPATELRQPQLAVGRDRRAAIVLGVTERYPRPGGLTDDVIARVRREREDEVARDPLVARRIGAGGTVRLGISRL